MAVKFVLQPDLWIFWEGGQRDFVYDFKHRYIAIEAGWMSGKTYAGARKLISLHLLNSVDARGKPTYVPSLVVAPSINALEDFMIPELEKACSEINLDFEYQPGKRRVALPDLGHRGGMISHIKMRTAERPDLITGFEVGAIWGDEAARWKCDMHNPKNDPFIQCIGRLRHPKANILQALFTYTNEGDTTRVYKWIREQNEQRDRAVYQARTLDNPVAKDFYEAMSGALTDDLKVQYLEGGAITLSGGNVYRAFNPDVNIDQNIGYDFNLPLQISIDFNISPGMHLIIGQYDLEKDLFTAIDECFVRRGSVREIVEEFGRRIKHIIEASAGKRFPFPALEVYGDATGKSEWAGTGESCYMILGDGLTLLQKRLNVDFGVRAKIPKVNPYIEERINAVNVAFRDLNGNCHYKIHPRCERLIRDYKELKRNAKGEVDKNSDPELSHASDAEGYRIHYQRPVRKIGNRMGGRVSVNATVYNNPIVSV